MGPSTGFWIGFWAHTVEQRKERVAWCLATPRFSSIFSVAPKLTERPKEGDGKMRDLRVTLEVLCRSVFIVCFSVDLNTSNTNESISCRAS